MFGRTASFAPLLPCTDRARALFALVKAEAVEAGQGACE
jgi:hypothetical protein